MSLSSAFLDQIIKIAGKVQIMGSDGKSHPTTIYKIDTKKSYEPGGITTGTGASGGMAPPGGASVNAFKADAGVDPSGADKQHQAISTAAGRSHLLPHVKAQGKALQHTPSPNMVMGNNG